MEEASEEEDEVFQSAEGEEEKTGAGAEEAECESEDEAESYEEDSEVGFGSEEDLEVEMEEYSEEDEDAEEEDHEEGDLEEDDEDEDDEDDDIEALNMYHRRDRALLQKFAKLPDEIAPLEHELAHLVNLQTSASAPVASVRGGVAGVRDPGARVNVTSMIMRREQNTSHMGRFTRSECCHVARNYLPSKSRQVDKMHSKAYIGQFNKSGDTFIGCFQHKSIKLYETENDFKCRKEVHARGLRWTITDTALSPDQRWLVYASITPIVHMVNMADTSSTSIANVTDIHETLDFGPEQCGQYGRQPGIWSLEFSSDGSEIAAGMGAGDPSMCLFNMETGKATVRVQGHVDDINAIRYADSTSNILYTGSDDCLAKVWDKRVLSASSGSPVGVLLGHTEGITHIDSKGDGKHLITNGKDQTIRLWDIRKMLSQNEVRQAFRNESHFPRFHWDYRCMDYPGVGLDVKHPLDCSIQTYRGHIVRETLIRCYFSPVHTTGQRYIYTGSHEGTVYIYDVVSGKIVSTLSGHRGTVRDMSWHPTLPLLVSASWDGTIRRWDHQR